MKKKSEDIFRVFIAILIIGTLASCAGFQVGARWEPERKPTPEHKPAPEHKRTAEHNPPHNKAPGHLGIPPGHLPPPGTCRIWYPGKPPGHQPKPGNCETLSRKVPSDAWLLYRPSGKEVRVAASTRSVMEFRYYDASTGVLLRVEMP